MPTYTKAWLAVLTSIVLLEGCGGGGRPNYSAQTTPPEVAWVTTPPEYTITPSLTISVTATNVLGVGNVYVVVGSERTLATQQADGTWQAGITLPVTGHNIVTAWAEDTATPVPNSGQGREAPYQISADINYAPTPPSLSYDASWGSYADERNLQVAVDANGMAMVPAEYSFGPRLAIPLGGDIYKASTRLRGGTMTAVELESTNNGNIPVLRFTVPYNASIDPPLQAPTFVAHVTCPNCPTFSDAAGTMLVAAATDTQKALFDLPISTETIPALAQVQGTATVSLTVTVSDAAGVPTTVPGFNFNFHLVGPPLAMVEDEQYPTGAHSESTYAYHLSDNTYAMLWDRSHFGGGAVRLVRYLITNPSDQPVALQLSFAQATGGSWQAYEDWKAFNVIEGYFLGQPANTKLRCSAASSYSMDGFAYKEPMCVTANTAIACWTGAAWSSQQAIVYHQQGDGTHRFLCSSAVPSSAIYGETVGVHSSGEVALQPYRVSPELGGQERTPEMDSSGQWVVVPAATGGVPGTLVLYLTRSADAGRAPALSWNVSAHPYHESLDHYQTWDYTQWLRISSPDAGQDWYRAGRMGWYLVSAQDRLYGTLSGRTQPYGSGSLSGESASRLSVGLSREPLFTH